MRDIIRIVKEDILESLGRTKKRIPMKSIKLELKVDRSIVDKALKELEKEGLVKIRLRDEKIWLTKKGSKKSGEILKKHNILERYFKKTRSEKEAIKLTNILEHHISKEVIENIKKISTLRNGVPLISLDLSDTGIIVDTRSLSNKLFERTISMGVFPGEKVKITNKIPGGVIVKIKDKRFALDRKIAKEIKVIKREES